MARTRPTVTLADTEGMSEEQARAAIKRWFAAESAEHRVVVEELRAAALAHIDAHTPTVTTGGTTTALRPNVPELADDGEVTVGATRLRVTLGRDDHVYVRWIKPWTRETPATPSQEDVLRGLGWSAEMAETARLDGWGIAIRMLGGHDTVRVVRDVEGDEVVLFQSDDDAVDYVRACSRRTDAKPCYAVAVSLHGTDAAHDSANRRAAKQDGRATLDAPWSTETHRSARREGWDLGVAVSGGRRIVSHGSKFPSDADAVAFVRRQVAERSSLWMHESALLAHDRNPNNDGQLDVWTDEFRRLAQADDYDWDLQQFDQWNGRRITSTTEEVSDDEVVDELRRLVSRGASRSYQRVALRIHDAARPVVLLGGAFGWTPEYSRAAEREGWSMRLTPHGPVISGLKDAGLIHGMDDDEAERFLRRRVRESKHGERPWQTLALSLNDATEAAATAPPSEKKRGRRR